MGSVAGLALEAVGVEKCHKKLEVFVLACMRGGRHEQEMPGRGPEDLAEPVALGLFYLVAEVVGGHAVRLVDDY